MGVVAFQGLPQQLPNQDFEVHPRVTHATVGDSIALVFRVRLDPQDLLYDTVPRPLGELPEGLRVLQVASLRPGLSESVTGEVTGAAVRWREWIDTSLPARARFADGYPALVGDDQRLYLGCWPDETLLGAIVEMLLPEAPALPDTIRLRRRGDLTFAFNYGAEPWTAPGGRFVLGAPEVAPRSLAAWYA